LGKLFEELEKEEIIQLVDGIFHNVARLFPAELSETENWGFHEEGDFRWVKTDPPSEYPNWICDTRFTEKNAADRIRETIAGIKKDVLPPIWTVGPLSTPTDLGSRLEASGLVKIASFPGMVLDLQRVIENEINASPLRLPSTDTALEIRRVQTDAEFSDWIRVNIAGFHEHFHSTGCEESVYRNLLSFEDKSDIRFYAAFLDGTMVGAAQAVFYNSGDICNFIELHQCSVIPECRKMGIARRLVSQPLLEARNEGYLLASIFAEAKAADPYWLSMGFRSYCDLEWYMLMS
jgi:GNAT superfamily N-acetyltransferase